MGMSPVCGIASMPHSMHVVPNIALSYTILQRSHSTIMRAGFSAVPRLLLPALACFFTTPDLCTGLCVIVLLLQRG